jgi:diaminopimelate epimerase
MAFPAAASVDAVSFVKQELLHCIHPTVKVDKAQVEIDKPTVSDGDTRTTRVRVFYEGAIKKNSMLVEVMEKTGKPTLVRAHVLEDIGTGHSPSCKYTKEGWQELKP